VQCKGTQVIILHVHLYLAGGVAIHLTNSISIVGSWSSLLAVNSFAQLQSKRFNWSQVTL